MSYRETYNFWLEDDYFDQDTKNELLAIRNNEEEIEDRFYRDLEFGTGGLRGVIGAGTNRMNFYTVRKATQGLANYIIKQGSQEKGVAIAYDSRRFSPEFAEDTGESLFDKLCEAGGQLLLETLPKLENGSITPVKQDESKSSYAKMLTKELGHIDFSGSAVEIERLIRGLNSWPSAYTKYEGKTLKIWKSRVAENSEKEQQQKPGTIVRVTDDSIYVQTGDGVLELLEVQLEGKKRMQVKDFLLGHRPQAGTVLG